MHSPRINRVVVKIPWSIRISDSFLSLGKVVGPLIVSSARSGSIEQVARVKEGRKAYINLTNEEDNALNLHCRLNGLDKQQFVLSVLLKYLASTQSPE